MKTRIAVAAATTALGLMSMSLSGAMAATRSGSGFTTIHTTAMTATSITAPDAKTVVVGGVHKGKAVVEARINGTWVTQNLGVDAESVQVRSDAGVVWVLTSPSRNFVQTEGRATLWRSVGNHLVPVALPSLPPEYKAWGVSSLAVEGGTVVLTGTGRTDPTDFYAPTHALMATLTKGTWSVRQLGLPDHFYVDLTTVQSHHVYVTVEQYGNYLSRYVYDVTAPTPVEVGEASSNSSPKMESNRALVVQPSGIVTAWGDAAPFGGDPDTTVHGMCRLLSAGVTKTCAAPTWGVNAAVRLIDGRTVLGSDASVGMEKRSPGAYAVVTGTSAPTPVSGTPHGTVVDLAASPSDGHVWSVVAAKDDAHGHPQPDSVTTVQQADLGKR